MATFRYGKELVIAAMTEAMTTGRIHLVAHISLDKATRAESNETNGQPVWSSDRQCNSISENKIYESFVGKLSSTVAGG